MTTSTEAVRQSRAGVAAVLSGPRINPMTLRSVLGLKTKVGA